MSDHLGSNALTPGEFSSHSQLLSSDDVARALRRMAHEIVERNRDSDALLLLGLQTGGVAIAKHLALLLEEILDSRVALGYIDVSYYRDDLDRHPTLDASVTSIPVDVTDRTVLLVDDVLFTGRTIRAALNALSEWGRPRAVQLAVLVDRGHRELPIRPDFIGKNLPTSMDEAIVATLEGVWIGTKVEK
ncbi:MAG TPA: bifunctional pyr operon transcriptional regulator/uracil phosphoribosyltransferase PyrR [Acidimicrobiales bacterium]